MSNEERWFYYADALPDYAHKLVRIGGGEEQRYTARDRWSDAEGIEGEIKWTGDWDPISDEGVSAVIANIDNPKPRKPFEYWNSLWELRKWFGACLDAIEAGVITADQVPPESGLNDEVVAALKVVEDWDLYEEWRWRNTAVDQRGEYPILAAYFALGAQCRQIEAELESQR